VGIGTLGTAVVVGSGSVGVDKDGFVTVTVGLGAGRVGVVTVADGTLSVGIVSVVLGVVAVATGVDTVNEGVPLARGFVVAGVTGPPGV
jgi:hypothetical protein